MLHTYFYNTLLEEMTLLINKRKISRWWMISKLQLHIKPIQDRPFRGILKMGGGKVPLPKICHTYLTKVTVILYLKKTQKIYNHVTDSLISADISISSSKISKFFHNRKYNYIGCILEQNF